MATCNTTVLEDHLIVDFKSTSIDTCVVSSELSVVLDEDSYESSIGADSIVAVIEEVHLENNIITEEALDVSITEECMDIQIIECLETAPQSPGGQAGQVFALDVTGAGIVSNKVYVPDTVPPNTVITDATTDNDSVEIHFMAEGGVDYSPIITVDGIECTNLQEYSNDRRLFYGSVPITVTETRVVLITSSTGTSTSVTIHRAAAGPVITSVNFINGYPGTQTEVKAGDTYDVEIHFDPTGSEPISVDIFEYGALASGTYDLSSTELNWGTVHKATITGTVRATGTNPVLRPCRVSSRNGFGTVGNTVDSDSSGSVDGFNVILCNDLTPSFTDNGTDYPAGQNAFKDNETGTQETIVHDFTTVSYSSPNNDFSISNTTTYEQIKDIQCLNPGTYNDSVTNFRITAHRSENDTSAVFNKVIEVADTAPQITVTQPYARLRSSQAGATYTITATSDQNMASTPALSIGIPVSGTWQGTGWSGGLKVKTRDILIEDSGVKGSGDWFFDGSIPTNRAGIPATIVGQEVVGGFLARALTIDAWPNREVAIGTEVSDINKLTCENLSKGGDAPHGGTIFIYQPTTDNNLDHYTILNNDTWYNCDQPNAVSNTSGTAQVIIEEEV